MNNNNGNLVDCKKSWSIRLFKGKLRKALIKTKRKLSDVFTEALDLNFSKFAAFTYEMGCMYACIYSMLFGLIIFLKSISALLKFYLICAYLILFQVNLLLFYLLNVPFQTKK